MTKRPSRRPKADPPRAEKERIFAQAGRIFSASFSILKARRAGLMELRRGVWLRVEPMDSKAILGSWGWFWSWGAGGNRGPFKREPLFPSLLLQLLFNSNYFARRRSDQGMLIG